MLFVIFSRACKRKLVEVSERAREGGSIAQLLASLLRRNVVVPVLLLVLILSGYVRLASSNDSQPSAMVVPSSSVMSRPLRHPFRYLHTSSSLANSNSNSDINSTSNAITCVYPIRPSNFNYSQKHVCVGVRTYVMQKDDIMILLTSLLQAGYPRLSIYLADTDYSYRPFDLKGIASAANAQCCCSAVRVFPRSQRDVWKIWPHIPEDAGYVLTDYMLDLFLASNATVTPYGGLNGEACDYILLTNGDNYYNDTFLPEVLSRLEAGADIVATYFSLNLEIKHHFGCVMYSRRVFDLTGERYVTNSLRRDPTGSSVCQNDSVKPLQWPRGNWHRCDADLIERLVNRSDVVAEIIPKVLFIHR